MKCTALLTCEKIIIDKEGAHSIINVMLNAKVALQAVQPGVQPQNIPVPPNALTPNQWWIYTIWKPSADDVGKSFEQVYQVYWPNGDKLTENRIAFTQTDQGMHQVTFSLAGFPVGQQGNIRIVTWLDSRGSRVSDVIETFVNIIHEAVSSIVASAPQPVH